jgi:hypothetical protein
LRGMSFALRRVVGPRSCQSIHVIDPRST